MYAPSVGPAKQAAEARAAAPRVSIIMPTYNSNAFLESTVQSVLAQTFEDWELILCDDGSTDTTVAVAQGLAAADDRIGFVQGGHGGPAHARNTGFGHADPRSEYVVFLDSDDTWEPTTLATLTGALGDSPDAVAAYGLARATDIDGHQPQDDDLTEWMRGRRFLRRRTYVDVPIGDPTSFDALLLGNYLVTPGTCVIRRGAVDAIGGFDPATSPCEDWDFNLRLARLGRICLVDQVVLNWRRHPQSLSSTSTVFRRRSHAVRRKATTCQENDPDQLVAALEVLLFDLLNESRNAIRYAFKGSLVDASAEACFALLGLVAWSRARLRSPLRATRIG